MDVGVDMRRQRRAPRQRHMGDGETGTGGGRRAAGGWLRRRWGGGAVADVEGAVADGAVGVADVDGGRGGGGCLAAQWQTFGGRRGGGR